MKILVLTREFPPNILGGISYHLVNLYNRIADIGHDITVLAGDCTQAWNDTSISVSSKIDVKSVNFGHRNGYYVLYPLALRNYLMKVNLGDYDIAVSHTPLPYKIPDLPLIIKYHDCNPITRRYNRKAMTWWQRYGESSLNIFKRYINKKSIRAADYAIYNSNANLNGWKNEVGLCDDYSVIHNGVDVNVFYPKNTIDDSFVLFVGDTMKKGIDRVLDYADKADREVHIVGSKKVEHHNVVWHGRIEQDSLIDLYNRAAVTIHPARFESFGNVVLESLACGTPVVTTESCGASELLTEDAGVVTIDLTTGVERATNLNADSCIEIARQQEWENVAARTIEVCKNIK